jgi:hypothetical protein
MHLTAVRTGRNVALPTGLFAAGSRHPAMTVGVSPESGSPKCGVVAAVGSSTKSRLRRAGSVQPAAGRDSARS